MPAASARRFTYGLAIVFALAIANDLVRMPIQVADSLEEILDARQSPSAWSSFTIGVRNVGYFRPLRIAQIKGVFDLAQGHYQLAYRGFHALLVMALLLLFVAALRVESGTDASAAAFALTVLIGLHTFLGFVREAFPINHFLEIAVLCLAALNLAQSRGGWLIDVAACLVFLVAALTLESGLLVWVIALTAWLLGLRGISYRGVMAMTVLLALYLGVRFLVLPAAMPTITERASGFLFERLEPAQIQERFGDAPLPYHAYNVAVSMSSVLFSEPRDGLFAAVRAWRAGDVPPRVYLAILSSCATTLLIVATFALGRRRQPLERERFRLVKIAGVVLVANAAFSFAYVKDEIVSVAGVFYALAAYATVRVLLSAALARPRPLVSACVAAVLLALGSAWSVRSMAVDHVLRLQAFRHRNDWAEVRLRMQRETRWRTDAGSQALVEQLRSDALKRSVPNPHLMPRWNNRWFGD